jgi:hypothetical protein
MENYRKYHIPNVSNIMKRKVNTIHISAANSWKHEYAKCYYAYKLLKADHKFITEAQENKSSLIRDLVDLSTGTIYEVETDKRRAARFKGQKDVVVIKLWE